MTAHPKRLHRGTSGPRSLIARPTSTPAQRLATLWIDRHDPANTTYFARTTNTATTSPAASLFTSTATNFDEYRGHPEHKALDPGSVRQLLGGAG